MMAAENRLGFLVHENLGHLKNRSKPIITYVTIIIIIAIVIVIIIIIIIVISVIIITIFGGKNHPAIPAI